MKTSKNFKMAYGFNLKVKLMNTVVKDWCIVDVNDDGVLIGSVLWGIVVDDSSIRYMVNDYVCTSRITKIYQYLITTSSNSLYQIIGEGSLACIEFEDFELLRNGFNPQQINELRKLENSKPH
jgi:hypothetical protein